MEKAIRLDKFLADMGLGTRSQIKEAAKKGRITVNGETVKKTDQKVLVQSDEIFFDGRPVSYVEQEYFMLNKPQGVVSATEDGRYRTVVDLIETKNRKDLFPVGRLDRDTEGLLLITNDGDLAHRLLAPGRHVDKVYYAECEGRLPERAVEDFKKGLLLKDGFQCLPAKLEILEYSEIRRDGSPGPCTRVRLTIQEGKFHQVKRMLETAGCPVLFLKRLSMGPLTLDEALKPGEYRPLNAKELELLKP